MSIRKTIGDATKKLKGLAVSTSSSVSNKADMVMAELNEVRESISSSGSSNLELYLDRVFPKSAAPAYILHHSNKPNDYSIHFDLTHVLSQLDAGILSRPSVILYCGRSDINRDDLSEQITNEFVKEMSIHEQRVKELAQNSRREHRDALEKTVKNMIVGAAEAAFMRALLTIVTGPLGILVLLLLGSAGKTVDGIYELISMPKKLVMAGVESITEPNSEKRINAAMREEHKKINTALNNLDLKMHKDLIFLAGSYDNVAYPIRGERLSNVLPYHVVVLIQQYGGEYLPDHLKSTGRNS